MLRLLALLLALPLVAASGAGFRHLEPDLAPYAMPASACALVEAATRAAIAHGDPGDAIPLVLRPDDALLAAMGFPAARLLAERRFPEPTMLGRDGGATSVDPRLLAPQADGAPTVATFAGVGCLGIRPGALLVNLNGGVAFCTLGHVVGASGAWRITTAGHCTMEGQVLAVVAAAGNRGEPVLLDFGRTTRSVSGGVGNDWAVIEVFPEFQHLVTPTTCALGGPRGVFAEHGAFASVAVNLPAEGLPEVGVATDPDPALAHAVLHYGHGYGVGAGGTARAGVGLAWSERWFSFAGAASLVDSGSPAQVETGAAAGLVTHIVLGPRSGHGIATAVGTRAAMLPQPPADGQLVPWPVPMSGP